MAISDPSLICGGFRFGIILREIAFRPGGSAEVDTVFAMTDPPRCHCEERSDAAIPIPSILRQVQDDMVMVCVSNQSPFRKRLFLFYLQCIGKLNIELLYIRPHNAIHMFFGRRICAFVA